MKARKSKSVAKTKAKLRAVMSAVTAGMSFVGFQLFVLFLIKGWRVYPLELAIAVTLGSLLGWAAFPKSVGKCTQLGVITGLIAGYALIILMGKKV